MTATTWDFDLTHSSVNFHVRHLMVSKVHGQFHTWGGQLLLDFDDLSRSHVEVTIDVASLDTREDKRDAHLKSPDFFDAEQFPKLTFVSTGVTRIGDDELELVGDLTIRGTTRPVRLAVELGGQVQDPWGGTRAGFSARATISRKEFGLNWNALLETGGVVVGDKIEISLDIEAVRAAASVAA